MSALQQQFVLAEAIEKYNLFENHLLIIPKTSFLSEEYLVRPYIDRKSVV